MTSPTRYSKSVSHKTLELAQEVEIDLIKAMTEAAHSLANAKSTISQSDAIGALYAAQKKTLNMPNARKVRNWNYKASNTFYLQMIDFLAGKQPNDELRREIIKKGFEAEISLQNFSPIAARQGKA